MKLQLSEITYDDVGALIAAIGAIMVRDGLSSGAIVDGESNTALLDLMLKNYGIDKKRGLALINLAKEDTAAFLAYCDLDYQ